MLLDLFKIKTSTDVKVSALKTVSWRIIGTIDTIVISYFFTGNIEIAVGIGGLEIITKMLLYYAHERVWVNLLKKKQK